MDDYFVSGRQKSAFGMLFAPDLVFVFYRGIKKRETRDQGKICR